ncbi:carbohydrate kinase family protein [Cryptosporangium aurantiacum]|uniref:Sugar or nucleoside kinase, ribokinase family n=1 Tax=Cryptosporangium aurantiacum TaxID=134849 RepID=A0A1M7RBG3_9ACTN|nr:sugar kinase [Cryptosporangium aurantiacum]SHN43603.1 Sugar or nucleoside kinase, ribokinase family [Cryptosporangium aurantiacum]
MTDLDVLVVGDANPDLVLRGDVVPRFGQAEQLLDSADLVLGGSAAITAVGCARLGLRTALLARVGDDVFGTVTRGWLAERGVPLERPERPQQPDPTGLSVILSTPDDRAILTLPGTIPTLSPADVTDALLGRARHVHVASVFLQPTLAAGLADVFARARAAGVSTSLDTNWDPSERWTGIRELLANVDVFLPNTAELLAVTGCDDLVEAASTLVAGGTTVVLKDGARGGRVWSPAGEYAAPSVPVDVVDTTGAGDSFNAGFLAAHLGGAPLPEAVAWAAAAGSLSTRAAGGTAAQATPDEIRAALKLA